MKVFKIITYFLYSFILLSNISSEAHACNLFIFAYIQKYVCVCPCTGGDVCFLYRRTLTFNGESLVLLCGIIPFKLLAALLVAFVLSLGHISSASYEFKPIHSFHAPCFSDCGDAKNFAFHLSKFKKMKRTI